MNRGLIARRYASALWMYAAKSSNEDKVYAESQVLARSFVAHAVLKRVLENRTLSLPKKQEVLAAMVGGGLSNEFARFMEILFKNGRVDFLQDICHSYQNIYRREKKLMNVELTTATPVDKDVEQRMLEKIEKATGQTVSFVAQVDKDIVGGYVLRWGTYRIDASVTSRLRQMKRKLIEV